MAVSIRSARYYLGSIIMLSHFATIAVFVIFGSQHLDGFNDVLQGIATVAPVAAVYVGAFVNYVASYPNGAPDELNPDGTFKTMLPQAFAVQLFLVSAFGIVLIALPAYILISGQMGDPELSKTYSGTIDIVFAGYIGTIFKRLFPFSDA